MTRREYLFSGIALMALKYAIEAGAIALTAHRFWPPLQWLNPLWSRRVLTVGPPDALQVAFAIESLPFLWIGLSMSVRRAVDAGRSPWWGILFFVPGFNYVLMLVLSALPSAPGAEWSREHPALNCATRIRSALMGLAVGLAIGVPLVLFHTLVLRRYSTGLFFGVPFLLGAVTAFLFNRRHARGAGETFAVVALGQLLLAGSLLLYALEGVICIAMALPFGIAIGAFGGLVGREIALRSPRAGRSLAALAIALPAGILAPVTGALPLHEVRSSVEIAAPPDVVWQNVVAFSPLPEPTEWLFRVGVAYPKRARIEGSGVGALRRCEFSTGPFIEPITRWDAPRTLSFDVTHAPPPMREWSPYAHVVPPHLDGYFGARRGEFRLVPLANGGTRLEGSTWYTLDIHPRVYWGLWADVLVSRIHLRVLEHIRQLSEAQAQG